MKHINNNISKCIILLFLAFSTISLFAMEITIENKNNSRKMLQLSYIQQELCSSKLYRVGFNTLLNATTSIQCEVPLEKLIINETEGLISKAKWFATLKLYDPTSKEKHLKLKITNNKKPIVIHDFNPTTKKISITKGNKEIGFLTYPPQ